jgi:predicted DNA-binding transcriptional regulator AlpA
MYNRPTVNSGVSFEDFQQLVLDTTLAARPPVPDRFLRKKHVGELTGLTDTTIDKWIRLKKFPRGIKLGYNLTVWSENEITQWMEQQKAAQTANGK